jgi:hypothetical protein
MFKNNYEYAYLINTDENKFILITEKEEKEEKENGELHINIGNVKLVEAMNYAGNKGWEFIVHDENIGLVFKKVV